ncbi:hypothetical protein, partial [Limosilactobacillus reuteri]|uniref:hypothetical protein n=1 Tax=Limosilactobacillus reuteri TaxID=1598 RepID=UPI001CDB23F3
MKAANILSECSVAIFEPDRIYPDVSLIKTINIISEKTNEDPKGAETQERSSYLKQSLNLLYSQTENLNCNQGLKKVEFDEFSKLLTFECSLIIILELRSALSSKLINIVEFNIKPLGIYSVELEKSSKVMENMLGLNEKLYAKNEDKIMKIFKSEHGFDDESIISLLNLFDGTVTMFSKTKSEMKELLPSKLRLAKKQLDFFLNIMFFNTLGIKGNISKVIKNVNCSICSNPYVQKINGNIMVIMANRLEASIHLRLILLHI